jgi:hypothetical protein
MMGAAAAAVSVLRMEDSRTRVSGGGGRRRWASGRHNVNKNEQLIMRHAAAVRHTTDT